MKDIKAGVKKKTCWQKMDEYERYYKSKKFLVVQTTFNGGFVNQNLTIKNKEIKKENRRASE